MPSFMAYFFEGGERGMVEGGERGMGAKGGKDGTFGKEIFGSGGSFGRDGMVGRTGTVGARR